LTNHLIIYEGAKLVFEPLKDSSIALWGPTSKSSVSVVNDVGTPIFEVRLHNSISYSDDVPFCTTIQPSSSGVFRRITLGSMSIKNEGGLVNLTDVDAHAVYFLNQETYPYGGQISVLILRRVYAASRKYLDIYNSVFREHAPNAYLYDVPATSIENTGDLRIWNSTHPRKKINRIGVYAERDTSPIKMPFA